MTRNTVNQAVDNFAELTLGRDRNGDFHIALFPADDAPDFAVPPATIGAALAELGVAVVGLERTPE